MGEDVAQTDPNQKHVLKALDNLELLVVQEIFMSETAKIADVVLPGASFLEKSGTFTNGERRIQAVRKAVEPIEGCKTDGQIMVDVINQLGHHQASADPAVMLEEISQIVPFFKGVQWQDLGVNGLQWPVIAPKQDTKILHVDQFKRGKGKFHFFNWRETQELAENSDEFPFILTTSRVLEHYNAATMTRRTNNSMLVDKDILLINKIDADKEGIKDKSQVILSSQRGKIELTAEISKKVEPGILFTTFHFAELMVNRITGDVSDEETLCPEYKVVAVSLEPA